MGVLWKSLLVLITTQLQHGFSRKYIVDSDFIEPYTVNGEVDQFAIGKIEYLFVNAKMSFLQAIMLCNEHYQADLAFVNDFALAKFLAEALSETNLIMDTLWIAAAQQKRSDKWWWIRGDHRELVNQTIVDNFTYNPEIKAEDRKCLSFSRSYHDHPQFRPLACRARRALMCERPRGGSGSKNSTHPGWIKLGRRFYKIFQEHVSWETAIERCYQHDPDSMLAEVITFEDAQQLGRYLLIGRPSLENAWIGANWLNKHYTFEEEQIILSNHSDSSNYPPWRNNQMTKPGGCVLLDRHLSNVTLFVEAHCERERPYICYKINENENDTDAFADIIIGDDGYRLVLFQRNWVKARNYCRDVYRNYAANLVEVRERKHIYHLLYVMGENKTAVSHLWIGGQYNTTTYPPVWLWDSDQTVISTGDDSLLNWVKNGSYEAQVEEDNICLTMDRENHIAALNYGTICRYEQHFVCHFTAEALRRLQEDERQQQKDNFEE